MRQHWAYSYQNKSNSMDSEQALPPGLRPETLAVRTGIAPSQYGSSAPEKG